MYSSKIATMKPHPLEASFDPHGLNVLLVDNTFTSLFVISRMLEYCDYQVTPCTQPTEALMLLRNGDIKFDMVLTEVHFSQDMSGMKFLEIVQRESDLPVVIVSAEDRIKIMMESVTKGACAYLLKPVRMEVVRFLWQHVIRKKMFGFKQIDNVEEGEPNSSLSVEDKEICASSDGVPVEEEQVKIPGKKHRLVWTDELHQKFVDAVTQLGIQSMYYLYPFMSQFVFYFRLKLFPSKTDQKWLKVVSVSMFKSRVSIVLGDLWLL
ncbi:putative response regulator and transcription factor RR-A-type family [Helianthus annuus]|nr:putative response regulator and transcription factor RR-A-type family [Helianthus annuus]